MAKVTTALFGDIAVLPVEAERPIREVLEWLTDLQISHNGTESGLSVRRNPRQRFTLSVPEQAWVKTAGLNVEYGALRELWGVPLWTEPQYLGAVTVSTSALACVTDNYDFRDASLAFLYESPTSWQVVEIATVGSGVLNLSTPTNAFTRAWLMPMRLGYVVNNITRKSNGHNVVTDITFDIEDNLQLDEGDAPTQFLSQDIYLDEILGDSDRTPSVIDSRVDVVDYELGAVARRAPWLYNRVNRTHQVICETPAEVREFRQWLMRRSGRLNKFWQPTFESDLRKVSTGTINSAIIVSSDGYLDWTPTRNHVAFELDDGSWQTRTITSASQINPNEVQLNWTGALSVNASRIRRISYLGLKRLNADRIELNWIGGGVLTAAVSVVEVQP